MLDNVTREYEQDTLRDRMLHGLTEGSRGSLANLQMAVDMLGDEGLDEPMRQRFLGRGARRGRQPCPPACRRWPQRST